MALLFKTLFKGLFDFLFSKEGLMLIAGVVIALALFHGYSDIKDKVGSWFGVETKEQLKADVVKKDGEIKVIKQAVEEQKVTIAQQDEIGKNTVKAVVAVDKKETAIKNVVAKVASKQKAQEAEIKKDTTLTDLQKDQEIAKSQIDSLWESQCNISHVAECDGATT